MLSKVNARSIWRTCLALLSIVLGSLFLIPDMTYAVNKGEASVAKRSGKLYMKQKQYNKAIEQFKISVQGNPEDPEAQYSLGWLFSQKRLYEEMNMHFDKCLALKKGSKYEKDITNLREKLWTDSYNLGVRGINSQAFDLALKHLEIAKLVIPARPDTYKGLGITYLEMDRVDDSVNSYLKAIELDSTDISTYFNLSVTLSNNGQLEEAIPYLKSAARIKPDALDVLKQLATLQKRIGDNEGALETAEMALKVDAEDPTALTMSAQIFLEVQNFEQAAILFEKVIAQQPDNMNAIFNLAIAYRQTDQDGKAVVLFEKTVEADPNDKEAWMQMGILYDKVENFDGAIQSFEKVTELDPANARAWRAVSRSYARKSDVVEGAEAAECVKKAEEAFNMAESLSSQ